MKKEERKSIAEILTTPLGKGIASAAGTAATLGLANKALGTQRAAKIFARLGTGVPAIRGKDIAGASLGSGALAGLLADVDRSIYARNISNKIRRGGKDFTRAEKKLLLGNKKVGPPTGAGKNFSEHYFTPTSMGAFRGVLGGLLGGFSPLAFAEGAAAGTGGTVLNKAIMSRALAKRMREGKDLNSAERRLAAQIRGMRG